MNFLIADTFTSALARLPAQEQKAAKLSAMDLQLNPASPGLQMHRIDKSKDPNFWSARVDRDLRLILHKTAGSMLLAYVDHHDSAYAWAERRRIETHPRTGAVRIVETRDLVQFARRPEDSAKAVAGTTHDTAAHRRTTRRFARLTRDQLIYLGVPTDWVEDVQAASDDDFIQMLEHLPEDAADALLTYHSEGRLPTRDDGAGTGASEYGSVHVAKTTADLEAILEKPLPSPRSWRLGFARYLVSPDRKGGRGPLGGPSAVSYCSYVAGVGRALEIDFGALSPDEIDVEDIGRRLRSFPQGHRRPASTIAHWLSGLRALIEYRKAERERTFDVSNTG
jgi:hypothetical protein